jgi:hypothetical protein
MKGEVTFNGRIMQAQIKAEYDVQTITLKVEIPVPKGRGKALMGDLADVAGEDLVLSVATSQVRLPVG